MTFAGKKILVTGANGFIGKHLCAELIKKKAKVIQFVHKQGDIRDWDVIKEIEEVDMVYHLAGITFIPFSFENPREVYDINIIGTLNILELCRLNEIKKMIFTSSYVYGEPQYLPIDEKHPINPRNPYAKSKVFGEQFCKAYNEDYGIDCCILRPFNVYGEGQKELFLVASIIKQIIEKDNLILKDSKPKRDLLHVSDMIEAYVKAGQLDKCGFEVFNIGYGESYSVREIVDKLIRISKKNINVIYQETRRKGEIMDVIADIKKAKDKLNWIPKVDINEGLEITFKKEMQFKK